MLHLRDTAVRVVLLNYIAARLGEGNPGELREAGLNVQQLAELGGLSAFNLNRLAAMRRLRISVSVEPDDLKVCMRNLGLLNDTQSLETYFLRNGASCDLMRKVFKMGRRTTLERRRQWGAGQQCGMVRLPPLAARRKVFDAWLAKPDLNLRMRFYHLHQIFPQYSITALEKIVRTLEPRR